MSDKKSPKRWWKVLGPGIVSGASDNNPTTVASLAVIGSTTVYSLGWSATAKPVVQTRLGTQAKYVAADPLAQPAVI